MTIHPQHGFSAHLLSGFLFLYATQATQAQDTILVPCDGSSVGGTYCYTDNDAHTWSWQNECGALVRVQFTSGTMESYANDRLTIFDGADESAPVLYQNPSDPGTVDLTGLVFVGTSGNLFMRMTSNATNCCATDGLLPTDADWVWNWTASSGSVGVGMSGTSPGNFSMYPNPTTGPLTLRLPRHLTGRVEVRILNTMGSVVMMDQFTSIGDEAKNMDLHGLPTGNYCVVLTTPAGSKAQRLAILDGTARRSR